jgi:hypothetical protein
MRVGVQRQQTLHVAAELVIWRYANAFFYQPIGGWFWSSPRICSPYNGWGGQSKTSHKKFSCSMRGKFILGSYWACGRNCSGVEIFSEYFGCTLSASFHSLLHTHLFAHCRTYIISEIDSVLNNTLKLTRVHIFTYDVVTTSSDRWRNCRKLSTRHSVAVVYIFT